MILHLEELTLFDLPLMVERVSIITIGITTAHRVISDGHNRLDARNGRKSKVGHLSNVILTVSVDLKDNTMVISSSSPFLFRFIKGMDGCIPTA